MVAGTLPQAHDVAGPRPSTVEKCGARHGGLDTTVAGFQSAQYICVIRSPAGAYFNACFAFLWSGRRRHCHPFVFRVRRQRLAELVRVNS
jgi:hypothetical protein